MGPNFQIISLKKGDKLVTDDSIITNVLNKHFVKAVRYLAEKGGSSAHALNINYDKDPFRNYCYLLSTPHKHNGN